MSSEERRWELNWALMAGQDLEKRKGRKGHSTEGRKRVRKPKGRNSHSSVRGRASEKGLYSRNRVRKDRMGLLDGTSASGTRGFRVPTMAAM